MTKTAAEYYRAKTVKFIKKDINNEKARPGR